jgi:hypothetical protein
MTEDLHHEILVPMPDAMVQQLGILDYSRNISITMTQGGCSRRTSHCVSAIRSTCGHPLSHSHLKLSARLASPRIYLADCGYGQIGLSNATYAAQSVVSIVQPS